MKNVLILGSIIILLCVFGYVWLFSAGTDGEEVVRSSQDDPVAATDVDESRQAEIPESGTGTLEELMALGEDIECNITYQTEDSEEPIEGTYFVSDGEMRGDFLTPTPDLSGQMLSSMIMTDSMMYIWSEIEGETYGMKMDLSVLDEEEAQRNEPVALDEDVEYNCTEWENVDRTVFLPPEDVLFQDFGSTLNGAMEYGTIYEEGEMEAPEF